MDTVGAVGVYRRV